MFSSLLNVTLFTIIFFNCFFEGQLLQIPDLPIDRICENQAVGDIVGNITAIDGSEPYIFSILTSEFAIYVEIVNNDVGASADFKLIRQFDREVEDTFVVEFQVQDRSGAIATKTDNVYIDDANDNLPLITGIPPEISVNEYPWSENQLFTYQLSDPDRGAVTAEIENSNDFKTDRVEFASGVYTYSFSLNDSARLSFEDSPVLLCEIVATDAGGSTCDIDDPPQTSSRAIVIKVVDGPDTPPYFTSSYDEFLNESALVGTVVETVFAQDGDIELNWAMDYSIPAGQPTAKWFAIDSTTGEITLVTKIDREDPLVLSNGGTITFEVQATEIVDDDNTFDSSEIDFPFTASTTVTFRVVDSNDNYPTFYFLPDPSDTTNKIEQTSFTAYIDENTPNSITVPDLSIFVQDLDEGQNAQFTLTDSSDAFDVFPTVVNGEASLVLRVADSSMLDYEKEKSFDVEIRAESVIDGSVSIATVTIYLNDTNDNLPEFGNNFLTANISENASDGDLVIQVQATDEDGDGSQKITYSLNVNNAFSIDPDTGDVTVNGELDRESIPSYSLSVTATDEEGSFSTAYLTIIVLDKNDFPPEFQRSEYFGTILEGQRDFTSPLEISATDNDESGTPNNEVEYSIIGGELKDLFTVITDADSNIGTVLAKDPIDMEALGSIENCLGGAYETILIAQAIDKGNPPLSSTVNITVIIEDFNDHDPVFSPSTYNAAIKERSDSGEFVTQVFATDDDACSPYNDISYQIDSEANPDALNLFQMDSTSGNLTVRDSNLDRDDEDQYIIQVLAVDSGGKTGSATVYITIEDINDKPPVFNETNPSLLIPEDEATEAVIWVARAIDSDSNSNLSYSIDGLSCYDYNNIFVSDCLNPFGMVNDYETQEGDLQVIQGLDRETVALYSLTITVEDLKAERNSQKVSQTLNVNINDTNDNAPQFNEPYYQFEVNEESVSAVIETVVAVDVDEGEKGVVRYKIEDQPYIAIDKFNGLLTTTDEQYDRDTMGDWLNVTVTAYDLGNPSLESNTSVYIEMLDINDNAPEFEQASYTGYVSEAANIGDKVLVVQATDQDEGDFAEIRYEIEEGIFAVFEINETSGEIFVNAELDRETQSLYVFNVLAKDNGGQGSYLTGETSVTINITDVNDEGPTFDRSVYLVYTLDEDAEVGTEVVTVTASDPDSGENSVITYAIADGSDGEYFEIDQTTGVITLYKSIIGGKANYTFYVIGADNGNPPQSESCTVIVYPDPANLNAPNITNLPDVTSISENTPAGAEIFTVEAYDVDKEENGEIRYFIDQSNDFVIDSMTGVVTTQRQFDRETEERIEVTILVNDRGSPSLSTSAILVVNITDIDDNEPFYPSSNNVQNISVPEESAGSTNIQVNEAEDLDSDEFSVNYYFIIGGSAMSSFSLDPLTRDLEITSPLDREASPTYDLVVTVSSNPIPPEDEVEWDEVEDKPSMLHVIVNLQDINDNSPVFVFSEYETDIPFDSQPNEEAIIIQVEASDADEGANYEITYEITSISWILNNNPPVSTPTVFNIRLSRDLRKGDLYQQEAIDDNENGFYEVVVTATDKDSQLDTTTVTVRIIKQDETVLLYSGLTTLEFSAVQEQFVEDLETILNATVYLDSVVPHVATEGENFLFEVFSDVSFHARKEGESNLVPRDDIITELSKSSNSQFLYDYDVADIESDLSEPVDNSEEYLVAGLIIAGVLILVVVLAFSIAIVCMRRKYDRKLKVAEATTSAVHEMADRSKQKAVPVLPNTNDFAGGANPLYEENEKNAIDLNGWYNQESNDDDDSIDDNAVDNQDSAIGVNNYETIDSSQSDDGQDLDDRFDIDFEKGDNARLAAALSAANQRRGGENLTFMFDENDGSTAM